MAFARLVQRGRLRRRKTGEAAWHERCSWRWEGGEKITGMGKTRRGGGIELYVGLGRRTVGRGHSRAVKVVA